MVQYFPPSNLSPAGQYRPLTFSTNCDICKYPVQPSQSRYHCYTCAGGNYDICQTCYAALVDSGRISRENGDKGWRRCPRGHRTIVFFFEDSPLGQRRVIVNDLVGGHFLEDEEAGGGVGGASSRENRRGEWKWVEKSGQKRTRSVARQSLSLASGGAGGSSESVPPMLQKYPPDGGDGMVAVALYARLPDEGAVDELSFPRGAEIREADKISEDWFEGSYAGAKGIFPSNHVRFLGAVTM